MAANPRALSLLSVLLPQSRTMRSGAGLRHHPRKHRQRAVVQRRRAESHLRPVEEDVVAGPKFGDAVERGAEARGRCGADADLLDDHPATPRPRRPRPRGCPAPTWRWRPVPPPTPRDTRARRGSTGREAAAGAAAPHARRTRPRPADRAGCRSGATRRRPSPGRRCPVRARTIALDQSSRERRWSTMIEIRLRSNRATSRPALERVDRVRQPDVGDAVVREHLGLAGLRAADAARAGFELPLCEAAALLCVFACGRRRLPCRRRERGHALDVAPDTREIDEDLWRRQRGNPHPRSVAGIAAPRTRLSPSGCTTSWNEARRSGRPARQRPCIRLSCCPARRRANGGSTRQ